MRSARIGKEIALAGNMESYLAQHADIVLDSTVSAEACPNNLAPTSSTTAQLVMGDALAVCLMELKGFTLTSIVPAFTDNKTGKVLQCNGIFYRKYLYFIIIWQQLCVVGKQQCTFGIIQFAPFDGRACNVGTAISGL